MEPPTWPRIYVTLERIAAGRVDKDNLVSGLKGFIDEVALFLGLDDADPRIEWIARQREQRVHDPRASAATGKRKWRSYCRIVIAPTRDIAAAENPEFEPRRIEPTSKSSRPAPPEPVGGPVLASLELERRDGKTSRLGVTLRRVPKASGRGGLPTGATYIRLAIHWDRKDGSPWRSQGCTIRVEEVPALCEALRGLSLLTPDLPGITPPGDA